MSKSISFIIIVLMPFLMFGQEKKDRISFIAGTSQGISFMRKEAFSNTSIKTFETGIAHAYNIMAGISIESKSGTCFSDIYLGYKSYSNSLKGIVDINSPSGFSSKKSTDRFNYLSLEYRFSMYVKTIKNYNTFFSAGLQASYIINEKKQLEYENGNKRITTKGTNLSNNFVITTSPTFILAYGVDLDKGLFKIGKKTRLSLDFTYDLFYQSPSNQYCGVLIGYKLLF